MKESIDDAATIAIKITQTLPRNLCRTEPLTESNWMAPIISASIAAKA